MLGRTSEYAMRAVIHLAQNRDEWPITGHVVAKRTGIPAKYLSKVLSDLVRAGVLNASRGVGGGFRMVRSPEQTTLLQVLEPFEQFHLRRCPFGHGRCDDRSSCLAHEEWARVMQAELAFLRKMTIHDVAVTTPDRDPCSAQPPDTDEPEIHGSG